METPENLVNKQAPDSGFSLEKMRAEISTRIEQARNNPIAEARLVELEAELSKLTDDFIRIGSRDAGQISSEDAVENEILKSSAVADNIVEFKEMLGQLGATYGDAIKGGNESAEKWAEDLLAHENAHANVAQETGHEWVGYGAVFIKDEAGRISSIQPLHFTKPKLEWGPREVIEKNIGVTQAPEKYGINFRRGTSSSLLVMRKNWRKYDVGRK